MQAITRFDGECNWTLYSGSQGKYWSSIPVVGGQGNLFEICWVAVVRTGGMSREPYTSTRSDCKRALGRKPAKP